MIKKVYYRGKIYNNNRINEIKFKYGNIQKL